MKKYTSWVFIFAFSLFSQNQAFAQTDELVKQVFTPSLQLQFDSQPERDFSDTTGSFGYRQSDFRISVPLYIRTKSQEENLLPKTFVVIGNHRSSVGRMQLDYLNEDRRLFQFSGGLTGLYYNGKKDLFLLNATGLLLEDEFTLEDPELRWVTIGLFNRRVSRKFTYRLGGLVTYRYGRGILLPLAGFDLRLSQRTRWSFTLPLITRITHIRPKSHRYSVFLQPNGTFSNFSDESSAFNDPAETVAFSRTESRLGFGGNFYLSPKFRLKVEAGIAAARRVTFAENSGVSFSERTNFFREDLDPAPFLGIGIVFRPWRKETLKIQENTSPDVLDEFSIEELEDMLIGDEDDF